MDIKINAKYWQLVHFFALEHQYQKALIGSVEEHYFIEEYEHNRGANYLIGLCAAFREFSLIQTIDEMDPEVKLLYSIVYTISQNFEPSYWRFDTLVTTAEWQNARITAQSLISNASEGLSRIRPPRKPFIIEELIRVEHYAHASQTRKWLK